MQKVHACVLSYLLTPNLSPVDEMGVQGAKPLTGGALWAAGVSPNYP